MEKLHLLLVNGEKLVKAAASNKSDNVLARVSDVNESLSKLPMQLIPESKSWPRKEKFLLLHSCLDIFETDERYL